VLRKGWQDFLDAVALLVDYVPIYYLIAGDGGDRSRVQSYIRERNLHRYGQLLGHIDAMNEFYSCLDCFVLPSHWEPHGLSHLEAQSYGIPTVVSNTPGMRETVSDEANALLFEPGDVGALATCLKRVAREEELRARLEAGGRRNARRYTVAAFGEALERVYLSVV
jgi:glycosyltransferase involved in cell wall biosynthesis